MTQYTHSERENLETLFNSAELNPVNKTQSFSIIKRIWQQFVKALAKGNEPRVWQGSNRSGQSSWHGYDPVTGQSVCRTSESEMRIWLEERHYK